MIHQEFILSAEQIKAEAKRLGFYSCGIASAQTVDKEHKEYYTRWLNLKANGNMKYLENYYTQRFQPEELVQNVQSIICLALNYYPKEFMNEQEGTLSWYAYGKDYHEVMKEKQRKLLHHIQNMLPDKYRDEPCGRIFCDTAPVLERYWAWKAGLGWIGKNHQLIIPHAGSSFFLGEIFLTLPTDHYDTPIANHCGKCSKCLDSCPTGALHENGFDARRCLSYLTIENREELPEWAARKMGNCFYGCDRCQAICPHTRFSQGTDIEDFHLSPELKEMKREHWLNLDIETYRKLFKGSAVKRAKYEGLLRNIQASLKQNTTINGTGSDKNNRTER